MHASCIIYMCIMATWIRIKNICIKHVSMIASGSRSMYICIMDTCIMYTYIWPVTSHHCTCRVESTFPGQKEWQASDRWVEECDPGPVSAVFLFLVCESPGSMLDGKAWSPWSFCTGGGWQEERARRGAAAYHAAYVRGRGMRRRGTAAWLSIVHHIPTS